MANELTTSEDAIRFITGGNALFTITSEKTGKHYTYKVAKKRGEDDSPLFVRCLSNGVNTDWENQLYLGTLVQNVEDKCLFVRPGAKGSTGPAANALNWTLRQLTEHGDDIHPDVRIQHEGRCCACNRVLTDPTSIDLGIGPECRSKVGL